MKKMRIIALSVIAVLCVANTSIAVSLETLTSAANSGDANAMYELGRAYQKGDGVAKNDAEAAKWFEKAAELDHPRALFSIGYVYSEGIGVKHNSRKAYLYYKRAADLGNPAAMNNLGVMYHTGESICKDWTAAKQWYEKAVKLGLSEAYANLDRLNRNSLRAKAVSQDGEYYKNGTHTWKAQSAVKNTEVAKNGKENTMSAHVGFDVAKKARSSDGYMIISKVVNCSDAAKGGMLEGCDLFQIDNMNTKQFSYDEIVQYILKSSEKKATILIVFLAEDGTTKRVDIKLK